MHVSRKRAQSLGVGFVDGFRHKQNGAPRSDRVMVPYAVGNDRARGQLWVGLGRSIGIALASMFGLKSLLAALEAIACCIAGEYSLARWLAAVGMQALGCTPQGESRHAVRLLGSTPRQARATRTASQSLGSMRLLGRTRLLGSTPGQLRATHAS